MGGWEITLEALLDSYKTLRQIDQQELVSPVVKITTKILNFKACLAAVMPFMPVRSDGRDPLPDDLSQRLIDGEARALLRGNAYEDA